MGWKSTTFSQELLIGKYLKGLVWSFFCNECHTGRNGAQYDKEKNLLLKQEAQRAFEREHSRSEWMELIRKNYLG